MARGKQASQRQVFVSEGRKGLLHFDLVAELRLLLLATLSLCAIFAIYWATSDEAVVLETVNTVGTWVATGLGYRSVFSDNSMTGDTVLASTDRVGQATTSAILATSTALTQLNIRPCHQQFWLHRHRLE